MHIDPDTLSDSQYFGLACVVDGHVFVAADQPVQVGLVGDDLHPVLACAGKCVRSLSELVMERT
jgi:hypothetical protein